MPRPRPRGQPRGRNAAPPTPVPSPEHAHVAPAAPLPRLLVSSDLTGGCSAARGGTSGGCHTLASLDQEARDSSTLRS